MPITQLREHTSSSAKVVSLEQVSSCQVVFSRLNCTEKVSTILAYPWPIWVLRARWSGSVVVDLILARSINKGWRLVVPPYLEEQIAGRSWGVGRCNPGQFHFSESVRAAGRMLILSVIAVALLVSRSTAVSPMREVRRVLIINDLGIISSPGFAEIDQRSPHWSGKISVPDRALSGEPGSHPIPRPSFPRQVSRRDYSKILSPQARRDHCRRARVPEVHRQAVRQVPGYPNYLLRNFGRNSGPDKARRALYWCFSPVTPRRNPECGVALAAQHQARGSRRWSG